MSKEVLKCTCGAEPYVDDCEGWSWVVTCGNCYDGAPDAGRQLHGSGNTRAKAIADWNQQALEAQDDALATVSPAGMAHIRELLAAAPEPIPALREAIARAKKPA